MKFTPKPSSVLKNEKIKFIEINEACLMTKNEKYFLNSSHAALSSFQSSGRITRDIRFEAQFAPHPNFSSTSFQKNFVYP